MLQDYRCFRCGGHGHFADACDTLIPPASQAEHEERIRRYIEWRIEGRVNDSQKRALVEQEFRMERERKEAAAAARRERKVS